MMAQVMAAVAAFESDVASERQLARIAAKRARGEPVGTAKPYGAAPGEDVGVVLAAYEEAGSYSGAARLLNQRGVRCRTAKGGWWPSSVQHVVLRERPAIAVGRRTRGVNGSDFILSKLLRCPVCDTQLTGTRDRNGRRVRYSCRRGSSIGGHRRVSITEHKILPRVRDEAEHLAPDQVLQKTRRGTGQSWDSLTAKRERILANFEDGLIDRESRDRKIAAVDAELEKVEDRRVVRIRPRLGFSWPAPGEPFANARETNEALRAIFTGIELDPATFQPVAFRWRVPEWRSARPRG
jgi:hypothetical protein